MSSWRNLMTPMDKYLNPESSTSTLAMSRLGRIATDRENLNGSVYNQKLQSLQSEMNKLKGQLGKFSQREKSPKEPIFTPLESRNAKNSPSREEDNHEEEEEEEDSHAKRDRDYMGSDTEQHARDYIKLVREYQSQEDEEEEEENEDEESCYTGHRFTNDLKDYLSSHIVEKEERNYENRSMGNAMGFNNKYESQASRFSKDERKSLRDRKAIEDQDEKEDLYEVLSSCQNEISTLKSVVMESKMRIGALQEELSREKRETDQLKSELQRRSVIGIRMSTSESQEESPYVNRTRYESKDFSRDYQGETGHHKWVSLDYSEGKQRQKIMSNKRSKVDSDYKTVPLSNLGSNTRKGAKESSVKEVIRQSDRWQNSMDFGKSVRDVNVQCDFLLEKIADVSDEMEKEEQKEEIERLQNETNILKSQKNEMIETFQNIIQYLATSEKSADNTERSLKEVKSEFKRFHEELEAKLKDIDVNNVTCALNFSHAVSSPYRSRPAETTMEDLYPENYENQKLYSSEKPRYSQVNNLSTQSPPKDKSKSKQFLGTWKSHVNDRLSNNPKLT